VGAVGRRELREEEDAKVQAATVESLEVSAGDPRKSGDRFHEGNIGVTERLPVYKLRSWDVDSAIDSAEELEQARVPRKVDVRNIGVGEFPEAFKLYDSISISPYTSVV
jgi:hypothetical protein